MFYGFLIGFGDWMESIRFQRNHLIQFALNVRMTLYYQTKQWMVIIRVDLQDLYVKIVVSRKNLMVIRMSIY